jgi:ribosomal protein S18 acetylase RimI-like enzyme
VTRTTSIRAATASDADAIAGIAQDIGEENTGLPVDFDSEQASSWLRRLGNQGTMLIAVDGSIPIAFGSLDFNTTEPDIGLLGVWVLPEYRRRGLATELADNLIAFARDNGYRRIRGRLPDGNEPALSFLSAIGAMVPLRNPEMTFELPL